MTTLHTSAELIKAFINGITMSSEDYETLFRGIQKESSAEHWTDIQTVAIQTQDNLEERIQLYPEISQEYISESCSLDMWIDQLKTDVKEQYPLPDK